MSRRGVLGLVVAFAGCYEPPRDACTILCTPGAVDACPSDMTCEGGRCVAPGGTCTTALALVRVGGRHACGLDATGHALCWGDGHEGQLGVAALNDVVATPTSLGDTTWLTLATGNEHTCGIKTDHSVWCWGQNDFGEARGVHGGIANVPAQIVGPATMPATFDSVSAGGAHTCAIGMGQLWCWGRADSVGLGAETAMMTRFAPALADFIEVSAGADHTCAISSSMGLMCFGNNDNGQASGVQNMPVKVATPTPFTGLPVGSFPIHIAAGDSKNCAIVADAPDATSGALWCWGYNNFKDVGPGGSPALPAKQVVPELGWTQISTGAQVACGVRDHQAYCWGTESFGGLGDGVWSAVRTPAQAVALGSADEVYVSEQTPDAPTDRGYDELACLRDGDQVRCWGSNAYGDLGSGFAALRPKPIEVASPNGSTWKHVWLADDHTCGQTSDDALWCWGSDTHGAISAQLGHGTVTVPCTLDAPCDFTRPTAAPSSIVHPEAIAIGVAYTCALEAGAITCWGTSDHGVLGAARSTPGTNTVTPPAAQQWDRLYGANVASCGHTTGGVVSCWGHVIDTDRSSPTAINDPLVADLSDLVFGDAFACGAQTGGGRVCWGDNALGQLGDGTMGGGLAAPMLYPEPVVAVAAHNQHSCALTPANQIACWGYNGRGQCGQSGAMQEVLTPALVSGAGAPLDACTQVASGSSFSCAICDHAPWCWGENAAYQLGRGDTQVAGGYDEGADKVGVPAGMYTEVAAGLYSACAVEAGGALYCWGYGAHGELGDGSHASNLPGLIVPAAN